MTRPIVTDHAVLRYLDRVLGIDLDHIRGVIADATAQAIAAGANNLTRDGVVFHFRDGKVITVIAAPSASQARQGSTCRRGRDLRLKNVDRRHRRPERALLEDDDE